MFETVEVPFQISDEKRVLTVKQVCEEPGLAAFIGRFRDCFEYDALRECWNYLPDSQRAGG
jgi:hypothetical protein